MTPFNILRLLVIPLGRLSTEHLNLLCDRLEQLFRRVRCYPSKGLQVPEEHFDCQMEALVANRVLQFLEKSCSCEVDEKILGITDVDLCLPNSDLPPFLFGLAQTPGNIAIISTHRLSSPSYEDAHEPLFIERMTKEAMHELGHLSGLTHCHNTRCVMSISNNIRAIDYKRSEYCLRCKEHAIFCNDSFLN